MATILDEIVAYKKEEVAEARRRRPLEELRRISGDLPPARDFIGALRGDRGDEFALIAEIKRASPSKGMIRAELDPTEIARIYEGHGARAISVLTDERFFRGHLEYIAEVKAAASLPVLRKDFLLDPYQVYEARVCGADAVLLIASILPGARLREMLDTAHELGMSCLVEIHARSDLDLVRREVGAVISAGARIVGLNNRNLETFETDLAFSLETVQKIPKDCINVSESGIRDHEDVLRLCDAGFDAMLVGEALMRAPDIGRKIETLLRGSVGMRNAECGMRNENRL